MIKTRTMFEEHTTPRTHKVVKKDRGNYTLSVYIDKKGRKIGVYSSLNYWKIYQYDKNDNKIYEHDSDGNWEKRKYKDNTIVQFTNSNGTHWVKNN